MIWYAPNNAAAHARKLKQYGCKQVWLKAGVDNPGLRTVWAQWYGSAAQAYADNGVEPLAWFYIYPENPEVQYDTIKRALLARPSRIICLNAEVEWDDKTEQFVKHWIDGLRQELEFFGAHHGDIGFSSVPSWDKGVGGKGSPYHAFPYEAFCHVCDFSMPQAYFLAPDQVLWENWRNDTDKPVIPTLWAVGDPNADPPGFTDAQLVEYARKVVGECENFGGFSSWRGEMDTYQYEAMQQAYNLMPADRIIEAKKDTQQRADGLMSPIKAEWLNDKDGGTGIPYKMAMWAYNPDDQGHYYSEWVEGEYQPWVKL